LLFLTMHDDDATVAKAVGLGADGYVLKTASTDELRAALQAIAAGGSYLSPSIARRVMGLANGRPDPTTLTERELEILRLLAQGNRPAVIAGRLFVSVKTVKNHLTNVYAKLAVETGTQAVAEAYRRGLVSLPSKV
jgi:DNA-binding NarL/FixJ family response regulator